MVDCGHAIPVTDAGFAEVAAAIRPDALVDARMRKHRDTRAPARTGTRRCGPGPRLRGGENADVVVETALGRARWGR